jgi:hypothetical protein
VEGLIKGETLLHISGLKLADGPSDSQTLQVGPRPFALSSTFADLTSSMQKAARCTLFNLLIQCCSERLHVQSWLPAIMRRGCLAADPGAVVGRYRCGDTAAAQQRRNNRRCVLPNSLQCWVSASSCTSNLALQHKGVQLHDRVAHGSYPICSVISMVPTAVDLVEQEMWFSCRLFQQYLQDMQCLALALEDRFSGMLGEAALQVQSL